MTMLRGNSSRPSDSDSGSDSGSGSGSGPRRSPGRLFLMLATGAILALVFAAYLRPDFAFDLANRFIQCF